MPEGKITFSEAAKQAGIHINTIRNWRKLNRLKTAELVEINNSPTWVVEFSEIEQLNVKVYNQSRIGKKNQPNPNRQKELEKLVSEAVKPLYELVEQHTQIISELSSRIAVLNSELTKIKTQEK